MSMQNQMSNSITHAAIEPRNEGSLVGVMTRGKEPEPVGGTQMKKRKTERTPELDTDQTLLSGAKSPYPEA